MIFSGDWIPNSRIKQIGIRDAHRVSEGIREWHVRVWADHLEHGLFEIFNNKEEAQNRFNEIVFKLEPWETKE